MTSTRLSPGELTTAVSPLDRDDLRLRIEAALAAHLEDQTANLRQVSEDVSPVTHTLTELVLGGGKRLRPAFAYWGWRGAAADTGDDDAVVRAVACLELLHACALVHDDVMDGSETRRGAPAVHRSLASLHRRSSWQGSADSFGVAGAILVGDLCLIWADSLLHGAGLPFDSLCRALLVYDHMRGELMAGQYLDVLGQAIGDRSHPAATERALRVARYKSAKYTVERPLHLGAAIAGADPEVVGAYSAFGVPLGEAFQLRDDLLGVFGDPSETGKPAGDDLREGKQTVLIAFAQRSATPAQAALLDKHLGDPALGPVELAALREVLEQTGARAEVEQLIARRTDEAVGALGTAPIDATAKDVLARLAAAATGRRS